MLRKSLIASALLMASGATSASVIVLGNYRTGEIIIEGNAGGTETDRAVALAKGGSNAGWTQIYGPDEDVRGWGSVLCVRHKDGFFFAEARGQNSEAEANRIVNLKADRFLARLIGGDNAGMIENSASWAALAGQAAEAGLGKKIECARAWNNQGQQLSYVGKPIDIADAPKEVAAAPVLPDTSQPTQQAAQAVISSEQASSNAIPIKRDYEAEYQAKLRVWEQQQAEHRRKVEELEEAQRQFEAKKLAQREQAQSVLGSYQRQLAEHAATEAVYAERRRQYENATQQNPGEQSGIADAFKVQNDAEQKRVLEGLRAPRVFAGARWAYCYQPSLVDSTLYETDLFTTEKQKTELELDFSDVVAKRTRIGSGMSTYCYITPDASWLDDLRANVRRVHGHMKRKPALESPR